MLSEAKVMRKSRRIAKRNKKLRIAKINDQPRVEILKIETERHRGAVIDKINSKKLGGFLRVVIYS